MKKERRIVVNAILPLFKNGKLKELSIIEEFSEVININFDSKAYILLII